MAITSLQRHKLDLPHEPGEWIELRQPSYFMFEKAWLDEGGMDWGIIFDQCILAWSYPVAVTPEYIRDLDAATVHALIQDMRLDHEPEADQKKDSSISTEP